MVKLRSEEIEKTYYTIGEVAKMYNSYTSKIRFYSEKFKFRLKKNGNGERKYQVKDLEKLDIIFDNIKYMKMSGVELILQGKAKLKIIKK